MSDKRIIDFYQFKIKKLNSVIEKAKLDDFHRYNDESEYRFLRSFIDAIADKDLDSIEYLCTKYDCTLSININSSEFIMPYSVCLNLNPLLEQYRPTEIYVFIESGMTISECMDKLEEELTIYYNYLVYREDD